MLESILQDKREEIARLDDRLVRGLRPSTRDLRFSLGSGRRQLSLFAEFKRRNPGEEAALPDRDLVTWSQSLQQLGMGALVLTTESRHWGGSRDDLIALERHGTPIPLIRNDFIIHEMQLYESRAAGADAVFLRPTLLDEAQLQSSLRLLNSMHMIGIPLASTPAEVESLLSLDAPVLALCSADPERRPVDLYAMLQMAAMVPPSRSLIVCFDIEEPACIRELRGHVDAVCLGTGLLRAADPAAFLMHLVDA